MQAKKVLLIALTSVSLLLASLWLLGHTAGTVCAQGPPQFPDRPQSSNSIIRYVSPTGTNSGGCTSNTNPCATVQYAVDQASAGDAIHVATGVYTDIHTRTGITQVAYISKTVTVRGGYSTDFSTWNLAQYTTTLNALGNGRALYITGAITPTVEGLHLTGGRAADGGGIYITNATATISGCHIYSNTATGGLYGTGGGVFLDHSDATLSGNTIQGNTANSGGGGWNGGGVYLWHSDATLSGNTIQGNTTNSGGGVYLWHSNATLNGNIIQGNTANWNGGGVCLEWYSTATLNGNTIQGNTTDHKGGGVYLNDSAATLSGNTIQGNTTNAYGGGVYLNYSAALLSGNTILNNTARFDGGGGYLKSSNATLSGNTIQGNTAHSGGGVYLYNSDATLNGNTIQGNTANWSGGGVYLYDNSDATLDNNVIAANQAASHGSGVYIGGSSPYLRHNTLARNTGGDGSGVYVTADVWGTYSTMALTNTILVSHTVGISITTGNTAIISTVLWYGNGANTSGASSIQASHEYTGTPAFVNPAGGDYHILPTSAAVDVGVDAGVTTDIDGDPRPAGSGYDIGADEYICHPLTGVTIAGPTSGYTGAAYTFAANVTPPTATTPITYTWTPLPQAGQSTASITYIWAMTGTQVITVTAQNCEGMATATHTVLIWAGKHIYLPLVLHNYAP